MRRYFIFAAIVLFISATCFGAQVKKADLAGIWYPDSEKKLASQLEGYLDDAEPPAIDGEIMAIIAPHAGYDYSGPVAAYGFKAIKGMDIDTAIVVGFSHGRASGYYDGIAVFDGVAYQTPLGVVTADQAIAEELIKQHEKIYAYPKAFVDENSIEMEIPFLQLVLKDFKIVLIVIGDQKKENYQIAAEALYNVLKDKDKYILVGSTDMSHFLPYEAANDLDEKTISVIKEFDPAKLYAESLVENHHLMCGYGAVCATMEAARRLGADSIKILKNANSGDVTWNKMKVVGYLSAAIYRKKPVTGDQKPDSGEAITEKKGNPMLSKEQRKKLLQIARQTMEAYVNTGKKLKFKEDDPLFNREMGAFVTLHRGGQLRGCIGNIIGRAPLYLTVRDMAIQASTEDPRFPPVSASELADIDVEVSVLSEPEEIDDPEKIEMGKHGVIVRDGFRSGVYLPQVATETGWSRNEFMSSLCSQKAGLPPDAWKTGSCKVYVFTAEVFSEKEE